MSAVNFVSISSWVAAGGGGVSTRSSISMFRGVELGVVEVSGEAVDGGDGDGDGDGGAEAESNSRSNSGAVESVSGKS